MASSTLLSGPQRPFLKCSFLNPFRVHQNPNANPTFPPKFSISACSSFSWEREEQLWLREEQRWLREESRWRSERQSLLGQIAALRHRIEATERHRLPEAASVAPPLLAEETDQVKEMILEVDRVRVSEDDAEKKVERKTMLRMGSEGEDVRAMQSGTNGAPGPPVTKITEMQQTVTKETGDEEVEVSDHKVFLLGENRWEEQSRLRIGINLLSEARLCLLLSALLAMEKAC
ncbi:peptidoglycan binding domain containing protein [Iris pallida]|uniref:Peptidoglycan binding domain containing protein n=1 Tax=Iris pallida TaxID=29817 RepID=A0AAX6DG83_IRIPA|nr:peptidoglycan binding domain containing protein [Iris pallida]